MVLMLPAEEFELAIYRWVRAAGMARQVLIPQFYAMPGSNSEYALVVDRLKDLYANRYIRLSKIVGNYSVPYEKFAPMEGEDAFFSGGFGIEIAPGGRKFFESLEAQERREKQEKTNVSPNSDIRPAAWDVFISHASEDKESIARPLAVALRDRGLRVWYDEFTLKLGDSLRAAIDRGLAESRFGIVILSKSFFGKHWTQQELNGLAAIEVGGRKVILPIWHGVTRQDVAQFSPMLADRKAVSTDDFEAVVAAILEIVKPNLPRQAVYGETTDLHIGTRVHVRLPELGVPRDRWQFGSEIWVIRKTDDSKRTAVATPVYPPLDRPTPTVEGPMSGRESPFRRAGIPG